MVSTTEQGSLGLFPRNQSVCVLSCVITGDQNKILVLGFRITYFENVGIFTEFGFLRNPDWLIICSLLDRSRTSWRVSQVVRSVCSTSSWGELMFRSCQRFSTLCLYSLNGLHFVFFKESYWFKVIKFTVQLVFTVRVIFEHFVCMCSYVY